MPRPLATKRVYVPRKNRKIYVFDMTGMLIGTGSTKEVEEKYGVTQTRAYIKLGGSCKGMYFSLDPNFVIPESKVPSGKRKKARKPRYRKKPKRKRMSAADIIKADRKKYNEL